MADPTQTVVQQNAVSAYAAPYVQNLLGQGAALTDVNQNPYQPYTGQRTAGFTDMQNQAFGSAGNLQTPGGYQQGAGLNMMSGLGALQAGQMGQMAGMSYGQNATNPYAVGAYMNPYVQASLAPQLQALAQQTGINSAAQQSAATQAGAFGGSRSALANALTQQNGLLAANTMIGQGYNTAYNTAQQNMQQAAALGMQGAGLGLQGAQAAGTAGTNLANIAGQQLGAQQNIINQQAALGGQQQQQQQNVLNQQYQDFLTQKQYPYQQLSYMQGLLSGLPLTSSVQNVYSNPSIISQVAGLGTAAYALNKMKKGGAVKSQGAGLADLALAKMA